MKITKIDIEKIIPYKNNPRINDKAVEAVEKSIKQCEYVAPIIVDENNVILAGHTRLKALKKLGYKEIEVVIKNGLSEEQKKKYRLLDNKTNELADWDFDKLKIELDNLDFLDLDLDWGIQDIPVNDKYSQKLGEVIYEPKDEKCEPSELFTACHDFDEEIEKIKNIEVKEMLKARVAYFSDFNFSKIADYYAYQATPEEQKIFEKLALVLLDRDKLIENGFADLIKFLTDKTDKNE